MARCSGGVAAQLLKAWQAARTAASASASAPRAISAIGRSSTGEISVKVAAELTRRPPIQEPDGRWQRYANEPGNVYVVGRKGDPQGLLVHMLRQLGRPACG